MKTLNLKTITVTLLTMASITFSSMIKADDVVLPVISKPAVLQEGTQKDLSSAQIAELLPWAKNSKVFLTDLLESVQSLPSRDRNEKLIEGIKATVNESAPRNSELLMRYALNRGLIISEILTKELDAESVGSSDVHSRVLILSIKMAIKSYNADLNSITKKTPLSFAAFGEEYYNFLVELNKSVVDASAQYAIQKTALEWLQWDLYRDLNNTVYAPQIVKINNALKAFPNKKITDAQAINYIRQMKKLSGQLTFNARSGSKLNLESNENSIKTDLEVGDEVVYSYGEKPGVVAAAEKRIYSVRLGTESHEVELSTYAVKFDDGSYETGLMRSAVFQKFGCDGTFCVGEDVINSISLQNAVVEAIYSDHMIIRQGDNSLEEVSTTNIAKATGCMKQYCVGDKVVYTYSGSPAVIVGYLPSSGFYVYQINGSNMYSKTTASYLIKDEL